MMAEEQETKSSEVKEKNEDIDGDSSKQAEVGNLDPSCLRYVGEQCFYKDPSTGIEYEWDGSKWESKTDSEKDYTFDGETYYYTDKNTNVKYKWNKDKNEWATNEINIPLVVDEKGDDGDEEEYVSDDEMGGGEKKVVRQDMSKGTYGTDGNTLTYTDTADGTVYLWDKQKNAWFPKIDDDFLAHYQLSYGFTNPEEKDEKKTIEPEVKKPEEIPEEPSAETLKRKAEEPAAWFDISDETNNKVYVSNLPTDITEAEFVDLMQKCGLVMKDPDTMKMKVKLYTEPKTDTLKGDALCTYIKVESVALALTVLDGYDFRGKKLHVERAKFTMKGGSYDPSLRPKKKKRKDKDKLKKMQEKLFDWRPEKMVGERAKNEKVVIVKNLFDPIIFDREVKLILEYQDDLRDECRKCGDVKKVVIYDRHPEGVGQIWFKEFEGAEACVQLLDGRWFGQRKITAQIWDGKARYKIIETEAEIAARIQKWDKFLDNEEESKGKKEANIKSEEGKEKKEANMKSEEGKGKKEADVKSEKGKGKKEADVKSKEGKGKEEADIKSEEGQEMETTESKECKEAETEGDQDSDRTRSSAGSGDETD